MGLEIGGISQWLGVDFIFHCDLEHFDVNFQGQEVSSHDLCELHAIGSDLVHGLYLHRLT